MSDKLSTFAQVRQLEGWKAVAVAVTLCERMMPNYQLFCEASEFCDGKIARNCLDLIWEWIATPQSKINFSVQIENLQDVIPDPQSYDFFGVYPALDAAMSIFATVQLILGEDKEGAVVVSKLSQGSVETYLQYTQQRELTSREMREDPLMQWELEFQADLLNTLNEHMPRKDLARKLKAMAKEEGMSNIGIEI